MKVRVQLNVIGLSIKENEREGKKFYQISVDQEGEAGSLPMTEDCYKKVSSIFRKYSPCVLTCEFSDQYKYMRVIDLIQGK